MAAAAAAVVYCREESVIFLSQFGGQFTAARVVADGCLLLGQVCRLQQLARTYQPTNGGWLVCDSLSFLLSNAEKQTRTFGISIVILLLAARWGFQEEVQLAGKLRSIEIYVFSISGNFNGGVVVVEPVNCCTVCGEEKKFTFLL